MEEIKALAPQYFEVLFNQTDYLNSFPSLPVKKMLTPEAAAWISRPVSDNEIKQAVFHLHPEKALGPDGFSATFFQQNCEVVSLEVTQAIRNFFQYGRMLHEINHTFLTLVPKTYTTSCLVNFRPISCCNVLYKFISKILAKRMQVVIGELISHNQCAFLKGRSISDCFFLAHELVRDFNKPMGSRMCLKIDLKKAFDVNKGFVLHIMKCIGFPPS